MRNRVCAVLIVGLMLAYGSVASADMYQFKYVSGLTGMVGGDGMSTYKPMGVGLSQLTLMASDGAGGWMPTTTKKAAFCIELGQGASNGQLYDLTVGMVVGSPVGSAGTLYAMNTEQAWRLSELFGEHFAQATLSTKNQAAFQAAVWEIVNQVTPNPDGTHGLPDPSLYDVRSGWDPNATQTPPHRHGFEFQSGTLTDRNNGNFTNAAADLANSWLQGLDGEGPFMPIEALRSTTSQDFVVIAVNFDFVPAPGAVALGWIGLGLIGWARRRVV